MVSVVDCQLITVERRDLETAWADHPEWLHTLVLHVEGCVDRPTRPASRPGHADRSPGPARIRPYLVTAPQAVYHPKALEALKAHMEAEYAGEILQVRWAQRKPLLPASDATCRLRRHAT